MPAVLCTGYCQAPHLDERLPVLSILSWHAVRVNIRTPLANAKPVRWTANNRGSAATTERGPPMTTLDSRLRGNDAAIGGFETRLYVRDPTGVQRGEAPLRSFLSPKIGGQGVDPPTGDERMP